MEHLLTVLYAAIFFFIILKSTFFKTGRIAPKYFGYVFILKIFAGIFLGYLYKTYFNGGDTFVFFNDANKMFSVLKESPSDFLKMIFGLGTDPSLEVYYNQMGGWSNNAYFYNDSKTIIRINALIRVFSFGYYNVHVVFFSFFSLLGLNSLFKIFHQAAPEKEEEIFFSIFLIPSVIFWNSGILKEGILAFALGFFLYAFIKMILKKANLKLVLSFGISLLLLIYLKVYILILLFPGMLAFFWTVKSGYKNCFIKFCVTYLVYFIFLFNLKHVNPNYNLSEIMYWKQHNTIGYATFMKSGSFVEPPLLQPYVLSIVKKAPHALLNVFILPSWNQVRNPFSMMAALENLLIIAILLITLIFSASLPDYKKSLFFLSLFFVIFLFILIGLTTPIIGAMVRYKIPAIPFLLSAMTILFSKEKFYRFLKIKPSSE